MKFKNLILVSLLLLAVLTIGAVSASDVGADDTLSADISGDIAPVDSVLLENDENGVADTGDSLSKEKTLLTDADNGTFDELQSKIDDAQGELTLENDYVGDSDSSEVTISKQLTIDGNGCTISNPTGGVFRITADNVILKNINFNQVYNKAITLLANDCSIINCNFSECSDSAIYINGKNINISDSSFEECYALSGAAIFAGDNNIINNCNFTYCTADFGSTVRVGNNTVISGCSFMYSSGENGGAISIGENGTIINCVFENSAAGSNGGAVYFAGDNGRLENSSFNNCFIFGEGYVENGVYLSSNGGAVYWKGNKGIVKNVSFSDCSAYFIMNENSTVNTNGTNANGGAIYWEGTDGTIEDTTFNNCAAVNGAAVYSLNTLTASANNFVKCEKYLGGEENGIYYAEGTNTSGSNSTAPKSFSQLEEDINDASGTLDLTSDYVFNEETDSNYAISISYSITIDGHGHTIDGSSSEGVFAISRSGVVFKNINFINANSTVIKNKNYGCDIINCNFTDCSYSSSSTVEGGIVDVSSGNIENCVFTNCYSIANTKITGGIVRCYSGGEISGCSFINCNSSSKRLSDSGGLIVYMFEGNVIDSTFTDCNLNSVGAAVYVYKGNISYCVFNNCDNGFPVEISNGDIVGTNFTDCNNCSFNLITIDSGNIIDCAFTNCDNTSSYSSGGSSLINLGTGSSIYDSAFTNCYGSISPSSSSIIDNCKADNCNNGFIQIGSSGVTVSNCVFENSHFNKNGGVIVLADYMSSDVSFTNCSFINCSSDNKGGAIFIGQMNDNIILNDCKFIDCSASTGGAIYIDRDTEKTNLTNCEFINCSASSRAGAVYSYSKTNYAYDSLFDNCTCPTYSAEGAAVYNLVCTNCIFNYDEAINESVPVATQTELSIEPTEVDVNGSVLIGAIVWSEGALFNCEVDIIIDGAVIATVNSTDSYSYVPKTAGNFTVYARFNGDDDHNASVSNSQTLTVNAKEVKVPKATEIVLVMEPTEVYVNGEVMITATVMCEGVAIDCEVDYFVKNSSNLTLLGIRNNGVSCKFVPNATGTFEVFAGFGGNDNYNTSISDSQYLTVLALPVYKATETTVTVQSNEVYVNESVSVRPYVVSDGAAIDCTVDIFVNGTKVATVANNQTYNYVPGTAGTFTVSAAFTANAEYNASVSDAVSLTVNVRPVENGTDTNGTNPNGTDTNGTGNGTDTNGTDTNGTDTNGTGNGTGNGTETPLEDSTITLDDITFDYGQSASTTAVVTGATGITDVKVLDSEGNKITATIDVNGLTITVSGLNAGVYTLSATTVPDDNHKAATSNSTLTVNRIPCTVIVDDITYTYGSIGSANITTSVPVWMSGSVLNHSEAKIHLTYNAVEVSGLAPGSYVLSISATPTDGNYCPTNATSKITVNKQSVSLTAPKVTATYGVNKNLVITLKANGKALAGKSISVTVGSIKKTLKTNSKGQVSVKVSGLVPKTYTAIVKFAGDENYTAKSVKSTVVVKKNTPKLTAKNKSFKRTVKTKSYSITIKNSQNKVIKGIKAYIKVNGVTYSATSNAKGIATFKITKLTKKGSFKSTITVKATSYYNKVTKKVTIKAT